MNARKSALVPIPLLVFVLAWHGTGGCPGALVGFQSKAGKPDEEVEPEGGWGRLAKSLDALLVSDERAQERVGPHPLAGFCACLRCFGGELRVLSRVCATLRRKMEKQRFNSSNALDAAQRPLLSAPGGAQLKDEPNHRVG